MSNVPSKGVKVYTLKEVIKELEAMKDDKQVAIFHKVKKNEYTGGIVEKEALLERTEYECEVCKDVGCEYCCDEEESGEEEEEEG